MSQWPVSGTFTPDDGRHACQPLLMNYGSPNPICMYCERPMTRLAHSPDHRIDGVPCGFPPTWRFCFRRTDLMERKAAEDFWRLPTWRET